jgi:hypothetical protein
LKVVFADTGYWEAVLNLAILLNVNTDSART